MEADDLLLRTIGEKSGNAHIECQLQLSWLYQGSNESGYVSWWGWGTGQLLSLPLSYCFSCRSLWDPSPCLHLQLYWDEQVSHLIWGYRQIFFNYVLCPIIWENSTLLTYYFSLSSLYLLSMFVLHLPNVKPVACIVMCFKLNISTVLDSLSALLTCPIQEYSLPHILFVRVLWPRYKACLEAVKTSTRKKKT